MTRRVYTGADVFDGHALRRRCALVTEDDEIVGITSVDEYKDGGETVSLDGGTIMPGFVDLQVNGGGGVMFNDETTVDGLRRIADAHAGTGTRAILPTLITDTQDRTRAAVDAVAKALVQGVSGIAGLHLEGPHLSLAKKGAHDPTLIRAMTDDDEAFLLEAITRIPNLMVTVATESVSPEQIARLSAAGVIVSLGHTDCTEADAKIAFDAGAHVATHLFNAMSQLGSREPGLVGAVLQDPRVSAGLIADNIHVHATSMKTALAAKRGPGAIFLVTDAMSTVGSDIAEFQLNGRTVLRKDGRLTLEDGTLAGADLEFLRALRVLTEDVGVSRDRAYAMATSAPAAILPYSGGLGSLAVGTSTRQAIWVSSDHRQVTVLGHHRK